MRAGIITTTTSEARRPPCGWVRGWCHLVFEGSLVGACVGTVVWDCAVALDPLGRIGGDIPLVFFSQVLFAWPFALCFGVIPLTAFYVATRRLITDGRLTLARRAALGVVLGMLTDACVLLWFRNKLDDLFSLDAFSVIVLCALISVQASGFAVALLARSRWFGFA